MAAIYAKTFTRAYLRHLFKAEEIFRSYRLASYHNLHFLLNLMRQVREAVREERLTEFRQAFFAKYGYLNNHRNF